MRRDARENLHDPDFLPVYGENTAEARERVTRAAKKLADSGRVGLGFPKEYGGEDDSGGSVTSIEMLAFGDLSLMVKAGVQWGLFGGALQMLGTKRHHEKYLRDVMSFDLPGCFAMTETGHGSDVQQLRTTCTYDPDDRDLRPAHPAPGRAQGLHRQRGQGRPDGGRLRPADHPGQEPRRARLAGADPRRGRHALPGVTIGDDGPKAGLNGVDNGRLTFDHVKVPRDMLLDRYGQVAADGTYTSSIENETRRFFTMLGTLVRGRVSVGGSAASATKLALDIAVRYGDVRRQFAAPGDEREIVINDYLVHQRKLLPALATTYALHFAQDELVETMHDVQTRADGRARRGGAARAGVPGRRAQGGPDLARHRAPSSCAARPAAAPATCRRTGCRTSRPTPTSSPRSRATTPSCCSWSPRACSPATATRSARSRAGARSASSPTWSGRRCWSGRRPAR